MKQWKALIGIALMILAVAGMVFWEGWGRDALLLTDVVVAAKPIAAGEVLKTLEKINRELGTTVILSEHRTEEAFPLADRAIVMDGGRIIGYGKHETCGIGRNKQPQQKFLIAVVFSESERQQ